jgi:hypothetical protein
MATVVVSIRSGLPHTSQDNSKESPGKQPQISQENSLTFLGDCGSISQKIA